MWPNWNGPMRSWILFLRNNVKETWTKFFVNSAGVILLVTALARFLIAAGDGQILSLPDPVIGIPLRYAMSIVGAVELAVALICIFGNSSWLKAAWVAWLATDWAVFQTGLIFMGCRVQGTCIGSLTDPLHLSRGVVGIAAATCPFYLILGSYGTLAWLRMTKTNSSAMGFSKMSCPACGTHIKFTLQDLGRTIPCPHCQVALTLRKPEENLKMSCYFCKEHIEFPAHAIGTKMACPHCNIDITLKEPVIV